MSKADKELRLLGYSKSQDNDNWITYVKNDGEGRGPKVLHVGKDQVFKISLGGRDYMDGEEVLASQLKVKEMGW